MRIAGLIAVILIDCMVAMPSLGGTDLLAIVETLQVEIRDRAVFRR